MPIRRPLSPPPMGQLLSTTTPERLATVFASVFSGGASRPYHHWDKLRHLVPPADLTHEQWWLGLKLGRMSAAKPIPLRDRSNNPFWFSLPDAVVEMLHKIDQQAAGEISLTEVVTSPDTRDRYIISSLIEEAITSSQLEGASTTRAVAREMLRSGRRPIDRGERMILNNYRAMQRIVELRDRAVSPELLFEIHRVITEGTLENPDAAGRLQRPDEGRVKVWDGNEVLHDPPPASELPGRIQALCDFANGKTGEGFVHPVARAVILHFWLGYDHPFEDGNGRMARALFYWSMLSHGFWLTEFVAISRVLRKAPAKYARSFLYTETDENDLTYFIIYQLEVFLRAIDELRRYLERKMREVRETERLIRAATVLNHRQLALVSRALRDSGTRYTIESHRASHGVSYQTARTDLLDLAERGVLRRRKSGRRFYFVAEPDLSTRLGGLR